MAAFIAFWLCAWTAAGVLTIHELINGRWDLLFWLAGWCLGELFGICMLWLHLRPVRPEKVILSRDFLHYDAADGFRWKPLHVDKKEIKEFKLEHADDQQLTFDHGGEAIEIGSCLREPEREWLHDILERWRMS